MFFVFLALPGEVIQFVEHIFQRGWFNHKLEDGHGSNETEIYLNCVEIYVNAE